MRRRFRKQALQWLTQIVTIGAAVTLIYSVVAPAVALATEDDHAVAERLTAELDHDTAHRLLTADAVLHAKQALERSLRMRQAGDETRAREVDALARSWAEMGRDLAKTADAEAQAGLLRSAANDAGAHAERERALLEEAIARNGRMKAEIQNAEREETAAPTRTSAIGKSTDGGAASPKTPKQPKNELKMDSKADGGPK